MTKIIPKDYVVPEATGPLEVNKAKQTAMVKKAKELFSEPIEHGELCDLLEQHYVKSNEHYTSAQLKAVVDEAVERCPTIDKVIVVKRTDDKVPMIKNRDCWWHEECKGVSDNKL